MTDLKLYSLRQHGARFMVTQQRSRKKPLVAPEQGVHWSPRGAPLVATGGKSMHLIISNNGERENTEEELKRWKKEKIDGMVGRE